MLRWSPIIIGDTSFKNLDDEELMMQSREMSKCLSRLALEVNKLRQDFQQGFSMGHYKDSTTGNWYLRISVVCDDGTTRKVDLQIT
jgi:hypothetical protein